MPAEGDIRKTLRAYQRAVTQDPTNVDLRERLARYLAALGHIRQAVQELELCAKLLAARGELVQAISVGKRLLKLDPERTDILLFLTRHYAGQADLPSAQRIAAEIAAAPRDPDRTPPVPEAPVTVTGQVDGEDVDRDTRNAPDPREVSTRVVRMPERDARLESIELTVVSLGEEDGVLLADGPLETADPESVDVLLDGPIPAGRRGEPPHVVRVEVPNTRPLDIRPDTLPSIPLFSSLGEAAFAQLLGSLEHVRVEPGTCIEGTGSVFGDQPCLKILVGGDVRATYRKDEAADPIELGPIEAGSFIGEHEVLTGEPLTHVALRVESEAEFLVVPHERLVDLWTDHPEIHRRLESLNHKRRVRDFIAASPIFESLTVADRELLARRLAPRTLRPDEVLGRPGEPTDGLYLVREGELSAVHPDGGAMTLAPGDIFGVHSLDGDGRFITTLTATKRTTLLVLELADLTQVLASHPDAVAALDELSASAPQFE